MELKSSDFLRIHKNASTAVMATNRIGDRLVVIVLRKRVGLCSRVENVKNATVKFPWRQTLMAIPHKLFLYGVTAKRMIV